jgi:hypothetical protein
MEKIRKKTQEILNRAFELWEMKNWDPTDIDPIVNLLFSAIAFESINLENKLKETTFKIRDSLIHSLVPSNQISARPACGVAMATPIEQSMDLKRNHVFQYTAFINRELTKEPVNLLFQPIVESKLYNLKPKYKYDGNVLSNLENLQTFKPYIEDLNCTSIWYGVKMNDYIDSINKLSMFFSFQDSLDIGDFLNNEFNFTENVNLFHENFHIKLSKGFDIESLFDIITKKNKAVSENTLTYLEIIKESLYFFNDGFFQIDAENLTNKNWTKKNYPEKFVSFFSKDVLEKFEEKLLWLEFRFETITKSEFDKISIHFNSFPIINLKETLVTLTLDEPIQQIPLKIQEEMFTVADHEFFDDYHNSIPHEKRFLNSYVIRDLGMEKLTGQELHEMIEMLIEKFETENHAFQDYFNISSDEISKLREAMKPILSEKIKRNNDRNKQNQFAIWNVKNNQEIASIEIKCAVTNGEIANNIKYGEKLESTGSFFKPGSISMVTKTLGGRNQLSSKQKTLAVRNYILSGKRISTYEDIRNFCHLELGDMIANIFITDSVMKGEYGLRKCILVKIVLDNSLSHDKNLQIIRQKLENKLRKNSSLIIPVIVNLKCE